MSGESRKKHNPNHNNNANNIIDNNGLNWRALEEKAGEVATEAQKRERGKMTMIAHRAAVATVEDFINAREELARLGVHYERVKKEKTGTLRKGTVYRMVTEKYGNALDRQRTYNEKLNSLQGTDKEPKWVPGDGMVTIANLIPKIEEQTGQEYAEYITKIHEKIPKKESEDDATYGQRILNASNEGDLQFFAASALIDPESETDTAIKQRLSQITELQRRLKETPMSREQRDQAQSKLKEAKIGLYKIAVDVEKKDLASRKRKPDTGKKKSFWAKITSPILGKEERRNRKELRVSKKEGMAVISKLIPKIEGQTTKEYNNLIAKIYSRYPKAADKTSAKYEREIDEVDLYTLAARILVNPRSSDDDSGFFTDSVEDEIREKFKQIEDALKNPDDTKATELAFQMRQAKMDTFKKLVEKRIKTLANR